MTKAKGMSINLFYITETYCFRLLESEQCLPSLCPNECTRLDILNKFGSRNNN